MWSAWIAVLFITAAAVQAAPASPTDDESDWTGLLDLGLKSFMTDAGISGATLGILQDAELVYAEGQGHIRGQTPTPATLVPILGLSQLITAVAVLQLVERGDLRLTDQVFGKKGLLYYIKPQGIYMMDPSLHHITVDHLLQHTAGFDETTGPVYDPMLNRLFLQRGYKAVDIAREMNVFGILTPDDIIHFMVGQPLPHKPGTRVQHSHFGYCVLGRIIEEVTGQNYEDYVQENILQPAGMWHTRMGPDTHSTYQNLKHMGQSAFNDLDPRNKGYIPLAEGGYKSLFDYIPAEVLDSALGWHSNVYDMARFFTALFKRGDFGLLKPETTEILLLPGILSRPTTVDDQHYETMTFTVDPEGSFWHISSNLDLGMNVYMHHQPNTDGFGQVFGEAGHSNDLTLIFFGVSNFAINNLPALATTILRPTLMPQVPHNGYMVELADSHMEVDGEDVVIKYRLSEHKLLGYASVMGLQGYYPSWVHGYKEDGETHLITIFNKAKNAADLAYNINVHTDKIKTIEYVAKGVREGYQLAFLQAYHSSARFGDLAHVTIMTKRRNPPTIMFDVDAELDTYFMAINEGLEDGYIPNMQSVDVVNNEITVSFILSKPAHNDLDFPNHTQFRSYHDLDLSQLEEAAKENAQGNFNLVYLDTHPIDGKARFSAIFHQGAYLNWMLQTEIHPNALPSQVAKWQTMGYVAKLMVAYPAENRGATQFVALWVSPLPEN